MGRVYAKISCEDYRDALHDVYTCLKRNKALPGIGGFDAAVLDGHETNSSYLRHCKGCLERVGALPKETGSSTITATSP
jgi:hypothetical protein